MASYTDLVQYWQCPRLWGFSQTHKPAVVPSKVLRGQLVHEYVANMYRKAGGIPQHHIDLGDIPQDVLSQASDMFYRYWTKGYADRADVVAVEDHIAAEVPDLPDSVVSGHPDAIIRKQGELTLIELKTGDNVDLEILDISGQADYYAWLWLAKYREMIDTVALHIITPEYVTEIKRTPRWEQGHWIAWEMAKLEFNTGDAEGGIIEPHFGWWCRYCDFIRACKLHDEEADWQGYLDENFIRKGGGN